MTETNGTTPRVRLNLPRVEITLADGRVETLQILNADLLLWDRTAAKHGWPHFETAKALHSTFVAWAAAKRTKTIDPSTTWQVFSDELCLQVQGVEADDEEAATADPTPSAAEPA
jgi:hypothetical protein